MKKINLENKTILVTGATGFIGANLVLKLLHDVSCINIVGIDNMNDYYDVGIKEWRLEEIKTEAENNFTFIKGDIADKEVVDKIFNYGNCKRDFTYIDDIVEGIYRVMQGAPDQKNGEDGLPIPPYAVYNIGGGRPENLLDFVDILQQELLNAGVLPKDYDFEAHKELVPMQPGDVPVTYADTTALERDYGYRPSVDLRTGLRNFAEWYKEFYM